VSPLQLDVLELGVLVGGAHVGALLGGQARVGDALELALLGHLFLDFLGLDAVPLLELALLLGVEVLEVAADVADGALELGAVELGRVEAHDGLQARQLGYFLLVDCLQEGDLLFKGLHLVLAGHLSTGFRVSSIETILET